MKTVVISSSASLQDQIKKWLSFWVSKGYKVTDYPKEVKDSEFSKEYPMIHKNFYKKLYNPNLNVHFVLNEDKNNISGYIGPGVFAEIAFRVGLNLIQNKKVKIILFKKPSPKNHFYKDIQLWLSLGWVRLFHEV